MAGEATGVGGADAAAGSVKGAQDAAVGEMRQMMVESIQFNTKMSAVQIAGNNGTRAAKAIPQG